MDTDFYALLKDILSATQRGELARLSSQQVDLTMKELERRLAFDLEELQRSLQQEIGRIKVNSAERGLGNSSMPSAFIRKAEYEANRKMDDLKSKAAYLKGMWALEKQKIITSSVSVFATEEIGQR